MSAVFGIPLASINEDTSQQTTAEWDSLNHMKLVAALEEEFSITFRDDEVLELLNVRLIRLLLSEKGTSH